MASATETDVAVADVAARFAICPSEMYVALALRVNGDGGEEERRAGRMGERKSAKEPQREEKERDRQRKSERKAENGRERKSDREEEGEGRSLRAISG